jgi:hypothetical protein
MRTQYKFDQKISPLKKQLGFRIGVLLLMLMVSVFSHLSGLVALSATLDQEHHVSFRQTMSGTYLVLSHHHEAPFAISHHHHHQEHASSLDTHHHHELAHDTQSQPDHLIQLPEQPEQVQGHFTNLSSALKDYFQQAFLPFTEMCPQLYFKKTTNIALLAEPPPWETTTEATIRTSRLLI